MIKKINELKDKFFIKYSKIEKHVFILAPLILITALIGGLVELVPLNTIPATIEKVEGVRPYTPLELAGRNIYIREGCYGCHSQQIRPFRDEFERYGHYSLAVESRYERPFQWGSKRTGPDLARVGGKFSDEWQFAHLMDPRSVVPQSIMPTYTWLSRAEIDGANMGNHLKVLRIEGVPYSIEQIENATSDFVAQATPDADTEGLEKRYPNVKIANFDNNHKITEMDALIAYLQVLGTMVDFKGLKAEDLIQ